MQGWDPERDDGPGIPWPDGWTVDPDAFRCGIDFSNATDTNEISDGDLAMIEDWHRRVQGDVPAYVGFLAAHYPLALKAFRARYETSMDGSLPKQYIALCQIQLSPARMDVRRSRTARRAHGQDLLASRRTTSYRSSCTASCI